MSKQIDVLKLALEGGGLYEITGRIEDIDKCIVHRSVIKEALAQPEQEPTNLERHERNVQKFLGTQQPKEPEQEPVATVTSETGADISMSWWHEPALPVGTKLYTTPSQRTWVGLTDDEIMDMYNEPRSDAEMIAFGREVEAKLKEKNT